MALLILFTLFVSLHYVKPLPNNISPSVIFKVRKLDPKAGSSFPHNSFCYPHISPQSRRPHYLRRVFFFEVGLTSQYKVATGGPQPAPCPPIISPSSRVRWLRGPRKLVSPSALVQTRVWPLVFFLSISPPPFFCLWSPKRMYIFSQKSNKVDKRKIKSVPSVHLAHSWFVFLIIRLFVIIPIVGFDSIFTRFGVNSLFPWFATMILLHLNESPEQDCRKCSCVHSRGDKRDSGSGWLQFVPPRRRPKGSPALRLLKPSSSPIML